MTMASTFIGPRVVFIRFIFAAALATSAVSGSAEAQKLGAPENAQVTTPLSVAEARRLFVCKTHMSFSAGHGTQISYLGSDGIEALWYPGNARMVRGKWRIVEHANEPAGGYADICFLYPTNGYNPVTRKWGGDWECRPAHVYARSIIDRSDGDVFGLANRGAVPFTLSRERTTIDDLRKMTRRSDASSEVRSGASRDRGCGEEVWLRSHPIEMD